MDWKICAVEDLRRYPQMKIGVLNSRDKLKSINSVARSGRLSSKGGRCDSKIVDAIVETERLKKNLKHTEELIFLIERGLDCLTDEEKLILERFYMSSTVPSITKLKEEFGYESRSVYRLRDRALMKFTLAMYGVGVS